MKKQVSIQRTDLVILLADKNMEAGIRALIQRPEALGIRSISADFFVHPYRDPGILNEAHKFLAPLAKQYAYALVVFDRQGCGRVGSAEDIAREVQTRLDGAGWTRRSTVIVVDPELEIWVWSDSPHVPRVLGMSSDDLENLLNEKYRSGSQLKPNSPKEAMEEVLQRSRIPRSSSIYSRLAQNVSVSRCTDRAFLRLRTCLHQWFPVTQDNVGKQGGDR